MNNPDHPMWTIIRVTVSSIIILVTFQMCYYNGLTTADAIPIVSIIGGIIGVDITKAIIARFQNHGNTK